MSGRPAGTGFFDMAERLAGAPRRLQSACLPPAEGAASHIAPGHTDRHDEPGRHKDPALPRLRSFRQRPDDLGLGTKRLHMSFKRESMVDAKNKSARQPRIRVGIIEGDRYEHTLGLRTAV